MLVPTQYKTSIPCKILSLYFWEVLGGALQVLWALLLCTVLLVDVCCSWSHLGCASPWLQDWWPPPDADQCDQEWVLSLSLCSHSCKSSGSWVGLCSQPSWWGWSLCATYTSREDAVCSDSVLYFFPLKQHCYFPGSPKSLVELFHLICACSPPLSYIPDTH